MSSTYVILLFFISFFLVQMAAAICLLLFFRNRKKTGVILTFALTAVLSAALIFLFRGLWLQTLSRSLDEVAFEDGLERVIDDIPMKDEETKATEPTVVETLPETALAMEETEPETEPEPTRVKIVAVGDMLMHPQVSGCYYQSDGTLDYTNIFKPVKDEVANADIAVVNNEVPFGGNQFGLQNYPNFNVVTELGDAEAAAGFDVILNATNHVRDMGTSGILNTAEFWKKYPEIVAVGIHQNQEDQDRIHYIERNGVKIALFNYTYGLNAGDPVETYLVDMLYSSWKDRMRAQLAEAEKEADFTIVFPHWGEEYHLQENGTQQAWAEFFTECGADLIIGTHPHCLEPVKTVTAPNGNTSLCYYSLGNYISMQDETVAMLGGLAKITLVVTDNGVEIEDHGMQYLVTHYGYDMNGSYVLKLEDYSRDLSYAHGIPTHGFSGDNNVNATHPFSYDMFYQIIKEIGG